MRLPCIVYALALQEDGKILVSGAFSSLSGKQAARIGRLTDTGARDTNFNARADDIPLAIVVQPDGKIVVGGPFTNLSGQVRSRIGRLHPDGSLDVSFDPGANGIVRSLALQTDGQILVGGAFSTLAGQSRTNIGRLKPDGTPDPTFNPGADGSSPVVYALTVQRDGKILVGGKISSLGGQNRSGFGRLNSAQPPAENLTFDGSNINWLRGGSGPELAWTSFDFSTNGIDWISIGSGQRVSGGWRLLGLNLPTNSCIRARGYVTGGRYSCSSWFLENTLNVDENGPPLILEHNGHLGFVSNRFGFDVGGLTLRGVVVEGSTNLVTWSPLWTNLLGNGPVYFNDTGPTNLPRRFYRARLQ